MLCDRLTKALCGMLRAALLFYKKLRGDLKHIGFEVNPCKSLCGKFVSGRVTTDSMLAC